MGLDRGVLLLPDDSELKTGQRRENLPSLYQALIFCFLRNGHLSDALPGVLVLDAKTGYPVENDLVSVTIITESSFNADMLSTVSFLLDYDKTVKLKNARIIDDFEAEFIYKDGSVKRTEGFSRYLR